jgi:hypothetical protein
MTRYTPSTHYLHGGLAALVLAGFSAWCGLSWPLALIPAVLFLASGGVLGFLALRPPVEVHESHLAIGKRAIPWLDIRRLDRTGWISPLVVHITLFDDSRFSLIYPGDLDSANSLLRHLRRAARGALIDGIPYRQFWGEGPAKGGDRRPQPGPRVRVLRPEDEAEVERLFQRLKTAGHIDPKNSTDEK